MGETRVDLLHLLEDLRGAYPGSIEETILTEITANALDSGGWSNPRSGSTARTQPIAGRWHLARWVSHRPCRGDGACPAGRRVGQRTWVYHRFSFSVGRSDSSARVPK